MNLNPEMIPYYSNFWIQTPELWQHLLDLPWESQTPARKECFMSEEGGIEYSYGSGNNIRTYTSIPFTEQVKDIKDNLNDIFDDWVTDYNVCFLNRYDNEKQALDWHADDSEGMNLDHPIAVISFGEEREIYWKHKDFKGVVPPEQRKKLKKGWVFIMPAGFQRDHVHKIPKADHKCGTRISLTFRNYKK